MNLLNTADHKRIGQVQIVVSLLALAVAGSAAIAVRAMASSGTVDHFDALSSLDHALAGVFVALPLWFGIATVITPLQIGSNRLAFPKLSVAALWTLIGGMVLVIAGYTRTPSNPAGRSVFSPVPLPGSLAKFADTKGSDLMVLGMLLGAVATVLMAVSLVTTIASRRTHGLTIGRLPYFSWSVLVGGIGVALATPVFIGGLSLVWIDQHFGGSFFTSQAANVFWTHAVWLGGRPEALLAAVFVLGAGSDIIATATGRPNELDQVTRAALAAFATFAFVPWTLTGDQAGGVMAPFSNVVTILPVLAAGVVVLSWLGQLRHGVKVIPSIVPLVLTLALGAVAVGDFIVRLTADNRGGTWTEASLVLFALAIPVAGAVAALVHWAPKLVGGTIAAPVASLASLATFGGFTLFVASGVFLGADGAPYFAHTWDKSDGHGALALLGAAGVGIAALGIVILALGYAGARSTSAAPNPYGSGTTLEWATASPPPRDNFESVPDVGSATPLVTTGASS
ncbi:MAG: cytochrome c oxidase subunit [Actinomycetota bacterium]|jgi:cytochrome c oxidase subunit 1